jgi:excisionase family DNA binding protein
MDRSPRDRTGTEPLSDLTLHDAAALYAVSARTLAQHIRCGQLPAYKTAGATGRQWRITRDALDAAGYPPRVPPTATDAPEHPLVAELRRELSAARRSVAAERRRAEDADRRLGHGMLECGRLRAALAGATGEERHSPEAELDVDAARWLVAAVRGGTGNQRQPSGAGSVAQAHSD